MTVGDVGARTGEGGGTCGQRSLRQDGNGGRGRTRWEEIDDPDLAGSGDMVREELEALVRHLEQPVRVGHDAVAVDDEEGEAASISG